ncbi:hypothetical protein PR202_ga31521 [Eleusine coracana subsp. coracana]|uniref:Secreted protein n=1 Tax=Eleusine coracana subsp. coracana TaxID=191504 RepID=A0AAV5DS47_ELECO|nr:hypothetical protein PR202_ga31521 [Eleusine coracana subsp. coracana]
MYCGRLALIGVVLLLPRPAARATSPRPSWVAPCRHCSSYSRVVPACLASRESPRAAADRPPLLTRAQMVLGT